MIAAFCFSPLPLYLARRAEPALAHEPLVHAEDGRVVHANCLARKHGITPGMRLDGARLRIDNLQVISSPEPDLEQAWHGLLRELYQFTPWLESGARGWAVAQLETDETDDLARRYDARVGSASSREMAELAALTARPGECRKLNEDEEGGFLERLPLRFLKGVGLSEANLTRLYWLGLVTASDLARWSAPQLRSYLGEEGETLLPYLHGPRHTSVRAFRPPATLSRSLSFPEPVREPEQFLPALERLSTELERALAGRASRRLTLIARLANGQRRASRLSKRPLMQARHIRQQALFALYDSRVEGQYIECLTLELAEPERFTAQEGLWPRRERHQRALDATLERFPAAPRRFVWRDPNAQSSDLAWGWQAYATGAYGGASEPAAVPGSGVSAKAAARAAARAGKVAADLVAVHAAATAIPLFVGAPRKPEQPAQPGARRHHPSVGDPAHVPQPLEQVPPLPAPAPRLPPYFPEQPVEPLYEESYAYYFDPSTSHLGQPPVNPSGGELARLPL